jgi:hypothetical protein
MNWRQRKKGRKGQLIQTLSMVAMRRLIWHDPVAALTWLTVCREHPHKCTKWFLDSRKWGGGSGLQKREDSAC